MGQPGPSDLTSSLVTQHLFRGNPRLLIGALPFAVAIVALKAFAAEVPGPGSSPDWQWLELSPLLAGAIAAEVFVLGFLLNGTAGDFKEAERLPGEVAASLETMADECLIAYDELRLPEAKACLAQLIEIGSSIRMWLMQDRGFDDVLSDIRALNGSFQVLAPALQAGFTTRLKSEQASLRRLVIRMDTMRRTSYVAAGYLIAEVTAVLLLTVLILTDLGALAPTLCLVGLISYLLVYLVGLIRDLDNPFEYVDGQPGAADVNLEVLERNEDRLRALLGALDPAPSARQVADVGAAAPGPAATALTAAAVDEVVEPPV